MNPPELTTIRPSKKSSLSKGVVGVMSLLTPGVGQLYLGEWRGFCWQFPLYLIMAGTEYLGSDGRGFLTADVWQQFHGVYTPVMGALSLYSLWSVYRTLNHRERYGDGEECRVGARVIPYVMLSLLTSAWAFEVLNGYLFGAL